MRLQFHHSPIMANFKHARFIIWMFCVVDFGKTLTPPPKRPKDFGSRVVTSKDVKQRIKYSGIIEEQANQVHFKKRMKIAGSSGTCHVSMQSNVSFVAEQMLLACEVPQKLNTKIDKLIKRHVAQINMSGMTKKDKEVRIEEVLKLHSHYDRLNSIQEQRCMFFMRELLDFMEIWLSRYNNHNLQLRKDPAYYSELQMQGDDARQYILEHPFTAGPSREEARDWNYWFKLKESGNWDNFPDISHQYMPRIKGSQAIDFDLWESILSKITEKITIDELSSEQSTTTFKIPTTTINFEQDTILGSGDYESSGDFEYDSEGNYKGHLPKVYSGPVFSNLEWERRASESEKDDEYEKLVDQLYSTNSQNSENDKKWYRRPKLQYLKTRSLDSLYSFPKIESYDYSNATIPNGTRLQHDPILHRVDRQIFWLIGVGIALAIGSLVYSKLQVSDMADTANFNQDLTIQNLNSLDHRLSIQEKAVSLVKKSISMVEKDVSELDTRLGIDEMITEVNISLETLYSEVSRILRGWSAMVRYQLSPELVNLDALSKNLMELRDRMDNQGYFLGLDKLENIFKQDLSYIIYANASLWVFTHLPAYRKSSLYTVWEYNPIPFISPSHEGDVALSISPESKYIAVSEDDSRHLLLDQKDLDDCTEVGKLLVCENLNIINTKAKMSCMSSLFLQDIDSIKQHCTWQSDVKREFITQLESNTFLAYFMEEQLLKFTCNNGKDSEEKREMVKGAVRIILQGGCIAYSKSHIIEGELEWSLETPAYQLSRINMTQLLSTPYFTITPDKWDTWQKVVDDIGRPDNVPFKDVGPMYKRYHSQNMWDSIIKSILGVAIPILFLMIMWFQRKNIIKCCKFGTNKVTAGKVTFQKGDDSARIRCPPNTLRPPPVTSGGAGSWDYSARPGLVQGPGSEAAALLGTGRPTTTTGMTPNTSRKILDQSGLTYEQRLEKLETAEMIVNAQLGEGGARDDNDDGM